MAIRRSVPRSVFRLAQARLLARLPPTASAAVVVDAAARQATRPSKQSLSSQPVEAAEPVADPAFDRLKHKARSESSSSDQPGGSENAFGLPEPPVRVGSDAQTSTSSSSSSSAARAGSPRGAFVPPRPSSSGWKPLLSPKAQSRRSEPFQFDFGVDLDALGIDLSTVPFNPFAATSSNRTKVDSLPHRDLQPRRKRVDDWSIFGPAVVQPPLGRVDDPPRATVSRAQHLAPQRSAQTPSPAELLTGDGSSPPATAGPSTYPASSPPDGSFFMGLAPAIKAHASWRSKPLSDPGEAAASALLNSRRSSAAVQRSTSVLKEAPAARLADKSLTYPPRPTTDVPGANSFQTRSSTAKATGKNRERELFPESSATFAYPSPAAGSSLSSLERSDGKASIRGNAVTHPRAPSPLRKLDLRRSRSKGPPRARCPLWELVELDSIVPLEGTPAAGALVRILDLNEILASPSDEPREAELRSQRRATFATWLVRGIHELSRAFEIGGPFVTVRGQDELCLHLPRQPAASFGTACRLASTIDKLIPSITRIIVHRLSQEKLEPAQQLVDGQVLRSVTRPGQGSIPLRPSSAPAAYVEAIDILLRKVTRSSSTTRSAGLPQPSSPPAGSKLPGGRGLAGASVGASTDHRPPSRSSSVKSAYATDPSSPQSSEGPVAAVPATIPFAPPPPAAFTAAAAAAHGPLGREGIKSSTVSSTMLPDGRMVVDSPWGLEVVRLNEHSGVTELGNAPVWSGWAQMRASEEAPS